MQSGHCHRSSHLNHVAPRIRRARFLFRLGLVTWLVSMFAFQTTGCRQPIARPGTVVGSSMSPTILGIHLDVDCPACGFEFASDVDQANLRQHLICSNCGSEIDKSHCDEQSAESVDIELGRNGIERWDVIAFQMPLESSPSEDAIAGIKRVLGLPGESIEFENGNVLVDGSVARKSLAQQKEVRIPVMDSACRSTEFLRHWKFNPETNWICEPSFRFDPAGAERPIDWFTFLNQRNYSHRTIADAGAVSDRPVEDFYAFNQSLSRDLHEMDEVFIALEIAPSPGGTFAWRYVRRGTTYEFELHDGALITRELTPSSQPSQTETPLATDPFSQSTIQLEFSSFDQQIVVWLDDREVFRKSLAPSQAPISKPWLSIGAAKSKLAINRIQIWRDLYYFASSNDPVQFPVTVRPDGFFVVGDNVPCSQDSRHWQTPSLPKSRVIGKVKRL